MIRVYVVKKLSKAGTEYIKMFADLGYGKQDITYEKETITALLDIGPSRLFTMCKEVDKEIHVADLNIILDKVGAK